MKITRRGFVFGGWMLLTGGVAGCQLRKAPRVTNLKASAAVFNPSRGETITLSYALDRAAQVVVTIQDALGRSICTLSDERQMAGSHNVVWNGKDDAGRTVFDEAYGWTVTARSDEAEASINSFSALKGGGQIVAAEDRRLDRGDGAIHYRLPQPARIRLRMGIKGGALAQTLLDWSPQPAGDHVVQWDGKDADGVIDLRTHPDLAYDLSAFALPENALIAQGNPAPQGMLPFLDFDPTIRPQQVVDATNSGALHRHAVHPRAVCREPHFEITFPQALGNTSEGWPIVNGIVPVRIEVDGRDKLLTTEARFEVILYVDTLFLHEDEDSFTPYTYQWNTAGLNPGPHIITVNVHAYGDHIGARSAVVSVQP